MSDPYKDVEDKAKTEPTPEAKYWGKELELARQRQKRFRREAQQVVEIYEGDTASENSFNILYSNTETLLPAVYNQLPRPTVDRTFHDADPVAKAGAAVLERTVKNVADAQNAEYDQLHRLFQQAVLGALVPGQGATRIFYDAEIKSSPATMGDDEGDDEEGVDAAAQDPRKRPILPTDPGGRRHGERSRVVYETICGTDLDYDQVLYGYARRWVDLPWLGFEHFMNKDDLIANFGEETAEEIEIGPYARQDVEGWKRKDEGEDRERNHGSQHGAYVIEIWNKARRQVVFYCETYPQKLIGEPRDDPYGLSRFYPIPEPLKFQMKTSGIIPRPIYKLYEPQAKELNRLSIRINRILNALKVRGFYDASMQGLKDLMTKDDNTLLPVPNASAMTEGKTIGNSIWLMPLAELVTVLQQLLMGREQCKNTIYEITGLSDIMRGDTQASETYGAQKLKSRWGSQRLQKFQGEVQRYCRDCYRIIAEMAAKNFGEETFVKITNLDYATEQAVQRAQQVMQMMQMMQMRMALAGPASQGLAALPQGGGGTPAVPPQLVQAAQEAQAVLAKPRWGDVLGVLREDMARFYRIDIETNSTIDPTRQEDKQDIIEVMTALANTVESFGPLVEQRVFPMPAFKALVGAIVRRFTFGKDVEDALSAIPDEIPNTVNNTPKAEGGDAAGPSPEELQATQAAAANKLKAEQIKAQNMDKEAQLAIAELELKLETVKQQREANERKHQLEMEKMAAEIAKQNIDVDAKQTQAATAVQAAKDTSAIQQGDLKAQSDAKRQELAMKPAAEGTQAPGPRHFKVVKNPDGTKDILDFSAQQDAIKKARRHRMTKNKDGSTDIVEVPGKI